jgi:transketolase
VVRPADANETAEAWGWAIGHDGPTLFVLSRQNIPHLDRSNGKDVSIAKGAYIISEAEGGTPEVILIGTGSEVALCFKAQEKLKTYGVKARVVSMPSMSLFDAQDAAYKESVLPQAVKKRVTVEAGSTFGWDRYAGNEGVKIGIDHYGASAPGDVVMKNFGFTVGNVAGAALRLLGREEDAKKESASEETAFTGPTQGHGGHS